MGRKRKGKRLPVEGVYTYTTQQQKPTTVNEYLGTHSSRNPQYTCEEMEKGHEIDDDFWNLMKNNSRKSNVVLEYSPSNTLNYFDDCAGEWHMKHLQSILPALQNEAPIFDADGISEGYAYYGSWGTCFPWHKENGDLNSLNYHFWGFPKIWYVIGEKYAAATERVVAKLFPTMANCPSFMRHKMNLVHPSVFIQAGIPVYRLVQRPGDFVVTCNLCYHTGFNSGTNLAHATNFGSMRWPSYASNLDRCECEWDEEEDEMVQLPIDFMTRVSKPKSTRKKARFGCCDVVARDVQRVIIYMKNNPKKAWTLAQSIKLRKKPEHCCEVTLTSMYKEIITKGGARKKKLTPNEITNLRDRMRTAEFVNLFEKKCPAAYLMSPPSSEEDISDQINDESNDETNDGSSDSDDE